MAGDWLFTHFIARMSPVHKKGRYPIPKTDRVDNPIMKKALREIGFKYERKYGPTTPNPISCYKAKKRFDREPYPASSNTRFWSDDARSVVETAWILAKAMLFQHHDPYVNGCRVLTWEEVIAEVAKDKSTGWQWRDRFRTKKDFLAWALARDFLDEFWELLQYDDFPRPFWLDKQKLEVRLLEKIADNNIRGFNCSSVEFVLASNRLCLHFNHNMYEAAAEQQIFSTVGMSRYRGGWDRMIRRHLKMNRKGSFSIDFKKWDAAFCAALHWVCFQLRTRNIHLSPEDLARQFNLMLARCYRLTYAELGEILMVFGGMGSGDPNTIVDNTIGQDQLIFFAYCYLCLISKRSPLYPDFMRNVFVSSCGDDCLLTVSEEWLLWFNPVTIQSAMDIFSQVLEFETLTPRSADECTYLGCTSVQLYGMWLPSPKVERVIGCLVEGSKSDNVLWVLLRLYAVRIDTWGNVEIRKIVQSSIEWIWQNYRHLLKGEVQVPGKEHVLSWESIHSVYKSDGQIASLYTGLEHDGLASNQMFRHIFGAMSEKKDLKPENSLYYKICASADVDPHLLNNLDNSIAEAIQAVMQQATGCISVERQSKSIDVKHCCPEKVAAQGGTSHLRGTRVGEASNPGPWTDAFQKAFRFKYHGNWGGPNYGAGSFQDRHSDQPDWTVPAIDALDESFKRHDYNYSRMPQWKADALWLQEAQRLPPSLKRSAAEAGFWAKLELANPRALLGKHQEQVDDPGGYPWMNAEEKVFTDVNTHPEPSFDSTLGYPGEGPPKSKKRSQKRKSKKRSKKQNKKKNSVKFIGPRNKVRSRKVVVRSRVNRSVPAMIIPKSTKLMAKTMGNQRIVEFDKAYVGDFSITQKSGTYNSGATYKYGPLLPWLPVLEISPFTAGVQQFTSGLPTRMQNQARMHEQYQLLGWTIHIEPSVGTNQFGKYYVWCDEDPSDDNTFQFGSEAVVQLAQSHGALSGEFRQGIKSFSFPTKNKKWFYPFQTSDNDLRLVTPGNMYLILADEPQGVYDSAWISQFGGTVNDGTVKIADITLTAKFAFRKPKLVEEFDRVVLQTLGFSFNATTWDLFGGGGADKPLSTDVQGVQNANSNVFQLLGPFNLGTATVTQFSTQADSKVPTNWTTVGNQTTLNLASQMVLALNYGISTPEAKYYLVTMELNTQLSATQTGNYGLSFYVGYLVDGVFCEPPQDDSMPLATDNLFTWSLNAPVVGGFQYDANVTTNGSSVVAQFVFCVPQGCKAAQKTNQSTGALVYMILGGTNNATGVLQSSIISVTVSPWSFMKSDWLVEGVGVSRPNHRRVRGQPIHPPHVLRTQRRLKSENDVKQKPQEGKSFDKWDDIPDSVVDFSKLVIENKRLKEEHKQLKEQVRKAEQLDSIMRVVESDSPVVVPTLSPPPKKTSTK